MNPSEINSKSVGEVAVTFHLKDELASNKYSSSSLGELDNEELDESIDDAGSEDSRVYHKKLKNVNRAILHPKKNLILLSNIDEENSKSKINFTIENKENASQPLIKRRKLSSASGNDSLSNASDDIDIDAQMEQVVGDDTKQSFKNCILKTMNEILRTNLQLSRKIDQIKEQNFYMNKRLKRLEQIVKIRGLKDQEVEEDVDLLSDLSEENSSAKISDDLRTEIKQEKMESRPSQSEMKTDSSPKNAEPIAQQLMAQSKRLCEANKSGELVRPTPNSYRPAHFQQQSYGYNYHNQHHPDAFNHYSYRYNSMHHAPMPVQTSPVQTYRPAPPNSFISAGSNNAQNPKTAAALAAAVAAAMAASASQADYAQENIEENEYDDSLEDETIGFNSNDVNGVVNGQFSSIVPQHAPIRHIPSSIVDQLELSEDVERLVSRDVIKRCIRKAKHRGNFAANLAAELFTKEERITCNCTGTRGKRQLSPRRLQIVKEITFRMYNSHAVKQAANISGGQQSAAALLQDFEEAWRKECITAIDAKNRSIGRDLIKNTTTGFAPNQQSVSPSISSTTANNPNSAPVASEVY